eukprot:CAMPEP_0119101438 /NCGR_PEP_ID=MMETSP1180-20130426/482_1 /TAXON_ID=3052 ORGANISM="Chlamydomonas cf sp, Strain CCMP681" /NCGR_SAMPLE_ID=MMETSP1180 /ASSEMBLY_ACC=CAM_ASM_000741 /LENGTH=195 /DNA_ID=CAMNT_0007085557 /DNA_START=48 /DNA_END=635 /DNA_ORIENTATION=+
MQALRMRCGPLNPVARGLAPPPCRPVTVRAQAQEDGPPPSVPVLVTRLKDDMKTAMKARDTLRLDTIRFMSAAIKSREIELRETGLPLSDGDVIKVLQKSAKQRSDSIDSYTAGGRQDLVDKEAAELAILQAYLPAQISREELAALVSATVVELGATGPKDMGKLMASLKTKTDGRADSKMLSELVKAALASKSA